ncbi:hypothetical protein ACIGHF_04520 [Stenotrophomonas sp. NPDC077464]|uniref:hypothetical protein n=1 Tax=unclassified Stenotrophomonas TaxID=196198 RepID=UPI0037D7A1AE
MTFSTIVRHLLPPSTSSRMSAKPDKAMEGFSALLTSMRNVPRSASAVGNAGYRAETRLRSFVAQARDQPPTKADFKQALPDVDTLIKELDAQQRQLCLDQGKPGSKSHGDYMNALLAREKCISVKHFR